MISYKCTWIYSYLKIKRLIKKFVASSSTYGNGIECFFYEFESNLWKVKSLKYNYWQQKYLLYVVIYTN